VTRRQFERAFCEQAAGMLKGSAKVFGLLPKARSRQKEARRLVVHRKPRKITYSLGQVMTSKFFLARRRDCAHGKGLRNVRMCSLALMFRKPLRVNRLYQSSFLMEWATTISRWRDSSIYRKDRRTGKQSRRAWLLKPSRCWLLREP